MKYYELEKLIRTKQREIYIKENKTPKISIYIEYDEFVDLMRSIQKCKNSYEVFNLFDNQGKKFMGCTIYKVIDYDGHGVRLVVDEQ